MKTLHKYLAGQVIVTLLLTVTVFAFVVFLLNGLKDLLQLIISGHIRLALVAKAVALLLPFAFVMPCRWVSSPPRCSSSDVSARTRS